MEQNINTQPLPSQPQENIQPQGNNTSKSNKSFFIIIISVFLLLVCLAVIGFIFFRNTVYPKINSIIKTSPAISITPDNATPTKNNSSTPFPKITDSTNVEITINNLTGALNFIISKNLVPDLESRKISQIEILAHKLYQQWEIKFIGAENEITVKVINNGNFEVDKSQTYSYKPEFWSNMPKSTEVATETYIDKAKQTAISDGIEPTTSYMANYSVCDFCSDGNQIWKVSLVPKGNEESMKGKQYKFEDGTYTGVSDVQLFISTPY